MSEEIVIFETEEKADKARVCSFLRELADKIETDNVVLKKDGQETTVDIPDTVELEVKLEKETGTSGVEHSLEVEIEWKEGETGGRVSLG